MTNKPTEPGGDAAFETPLETQWRRLRETYTIIYNAAYAAGHAAKRDDDLRVVAFVREHGIGTNDPEAEWDAACDQIAERIKGGE